MTNQGKKINFEDIKVGDYILATSAFSNEERSSIYIRVKDIGEYDVYGNRTSARRYDSAFYLLDRPVEPLEPGSIVRISHSSSDIRYIVTQEPHDWAKRINLDSPDIVKYADFTNADLSMLISQGKGFVELPPL